MTRVKVMIKHSEIELLDMFKVEDVVEYEGTKDRLISILSALKKIAKVLKDGS